VDTTAVSIVIPTYQRGSVLLDTVEHLQRQTPPAGEIVLIDQTEHHPPEIEARLHEWDSRGVVRWVRRNRPSVTAAMNEGLLVASGEIVLFLDDDIVPGPDLVGEHVRNYRDPEVVGVVGQILQPGQEPVSRVNYRAGTGIWRDLDFPFNSDTPALLSNGMAGNLSVRREAALRAGGVDESFVGVAYRFETDFCRRLARAGGKLVFDPRASLRHLQIARGGTRAFGEPLRSCSPAHSVGDYYLAFREARGFERAAYILHRFYRSVRTRYHLTHPWRIPVKWLGELRGLALAYRLSRQPPRLLRKGNGG
jgi:GT2 family glycosyltransferase